ncbi:hypothetical protein FACS1894137_16530 [Spirochaetia bacterium]|nr:hypothetical protein FACS1894137_16530 [Spirochaetia bacterium]
MESKEQFTEKALAAMAERVKQNVQLFAEVEERRGLNIDTIEAMWGTTKREVTKILDELYNDLVNVVPEKELLEAKKKP